LAQVFFVGCQPSGQTFRSCSHISSLVLAPVNRQNCRMRGGPSTPGRSSGVGHATRSKQPQLAPKNFHGSSAPSPATPAPSAQSPTVTDLSAMSPPEAYSETAGDALASDFDALTREGAISSGLASDGIPKISLSLDLPDDAGEKALSGIDAPLLARGLPLAQPAQPAVGEGTAPLLSIDVYDAQPAQTPVVGEGTGPLYKCNVCQGFIYESQLQNHLKECAEEDSLSPAEADAPQGQGLGSSTSSALDLYRGPVTLEEVDEEQEDEPSATGSFPGGGDDAGGMINAPSTTSTAAQAHDGGDTKTPESSAESTSGLLGASRGSLTASGASISASPGYVDRAEFFKARNQRDSVQFQASELHQHILGQKERQSEKRRSLVEELDVKEREACPFEPKNFTRRGSLNVSSRLEPNIPQRFRKLALVEAAAYSNNTHRPVISRFAEQWSRRQSQSPVFERLYALAAAQRKDVPKQSEEPPAASSAVTNNAAGSSASSNAGRSLPTSELLYSDALDRRERQRATKEQFQLNVDAEARAQGKVLSRSRRYYWHKLEREIKVAFDAASSEDTYLAYPSLEEFLIRFGCLRPTGQRGSMHPRGCSSAAGSIAAAAGDAAAGIGSPVASSIVDEMRRLRVSLWRHLDPEKVGSVDLLSLTVFFLVLLGASDDARLGGIGVAASTPDDGSPGTPTMGKARYDAGIGVASPGSAPGADAGLALAAIFEDEAAASSGEDERRTVGCLVADIEARNDEIGEEELTMDLKQDELLASTNGADALFADAEGRKIVELLSRFDPAKLRAEFKEIYTHRLHYSASQDRRPPKSSEQVSEDQLMEPELNSKSRVIAESVIERQRVESGHTLTCHADLLHWRHANTQAKQEEKKVQRAAEELKDCSFKPNTRATVSKSSQMLIEQTPKGTTRGEMLYARASRTKEKLEARALGDSRARKNEEMASCTFRPDTCKSSRSYRGGGTAGDQNKMPRGFYENRERLRTGVENRKQQWHQEHDRMAKLTPVKTRQVIEPFGTSAEDPFRGSGLSHDQCESERRRLTADMLPPNPVFSPRGRGSLQTEEGEHPADARNPASQAASDNWAMEEATMLEGSRRPAAEGTADQPPGRGVDASASNGSLAETYSRMGASSDALTESPALLYVDVNIAPGLPPERIVLREGHSISEIAAEFAARHVLTPAMAQRLHQLLQQVFKQQQSQQQTQPQ